jgi:hypothetical protein
MIGSELNAVIVLPWYPVCMWLRLTAEAGAWAWGRSRMWLTPRTSKHSAQTLSIGKQNIASC